MHRLHLTGRITSVSYASDKILVCNFVLVNNARLFVLAKSKKKNELDEHKKNMSLITVHGAPATYSRDRAIWVHNITLEE